MIATPIMPGLYLVRTIYRGRAITRVIAAPSKEAAEYQLIDELEVTPCAA